MYVIPPPESDPKERMVRVTDPAEIAAIIRGGLADPVGYPVGEDYYATADSLRKFRGEDVEIEL